MQWSDETLSYIDFLMALTPGERAEEHRKGAEKKLAQIKAEFKDLTGEDPL